AAAHKLATDITINGTKVNAGSNVTISAAATPASVMAANAGAALGTVGTYAFLRDRTSTPRYPGNTAAGSSFRYSSSNGTYEDSPVPAGTWMCVGRQPSGGETLFKRIA